jgi:hypothetical protein
MNQKEKVTIISVRKFPVALLRDLKTRAAKEGKPLYKLMIEILREGVEK